MEDSEVNCISIISNLCKFSQGVERDRLTYKFRENNYEKCERLIEFYVKYSKKAKEALSLTQNKDDDEAESNKFDNGLFTLQTINFIIGFFLGDIKQDDITKYFYSLFPLYDFEINKLVESLVELSKNLGEDLEIYNEDDVLISPKKLITSIIHNLKEKNN